MNLNPYFGWYPMDGFSSIRYVKILQKEKIPFDYNDKRNYIEIKTDESPARIHQLLGIDLYSGCCPEDLYNVCNMIMIGKKTPMTGCPPGAYY